MGGLAHSQQHPHYHNKEQSIGSPRIPPCNKHIHQHCKGGLKSMTGAPLHLAAKVRVAGRVHGVDDVPLIAY